MFDRDRFEDIINDMLPYLGGEILETDEGFTFKSGELQISYDFTEWSVKTSFLQAKELTLAKALATCLGTSQLSFGRKLELRNVQRNHAFSLFQKEVMEYGSEYNWQWNKENGHFEASSTLAIITYTLETKQWKVVFNVPLEGEGASLLEAANRLPLQKGE